METNQIVIIGEPAEPSPFETANFLRLLETIVRRALETTAQEDDSCETSTQTSA